MYRTSKTAVWAGLFIGSTIGGFVPELWGAGMFSWSGIVGTAVGGAIGIVIAAKFF